MTPKRVRACKKISAPTYFSEDFSSLYQENRFITKYVIKEIMPTYFLDVSIFEVCEFFKMFKKESLKSFIIETLREIYLTVVMMFFTNLRCAYGIITFEVLNDNIYISLK